MIESADIQEVLLENIAINSGQELRPLSGHAPGREEDGPGAAFAAPVERSGTGYGQVVAPLPAGDDGEAARERAVRETLIMREDKHQKYEDDKRRAERETSVTDSVTGKRRPALRPGEVLGQVHILSSSASALPTAHVPPEEQARRPPRIDEEHSTFQEDEEMEEERMRRRQTSPFAKLYAGLFPHLFPQLPRSSGSIPSGKREGSRGTGASSSSGQNLCWPAL